MTDLALAQRRHKPASPSPFRTLGAVALGDGARLAVQIGTSGGAQIINLRNEMVQGRAGMVPAGPGALVGLDRVPELIALLQRAGARS